MKYLDKYPNCVGCPVKKWCGTMISCLRLCRSYKDNKEETKMDYKKRYNQALEIAKYYHDRDNIHFLEHIFPELKESEDEKIRKAIVKMISDIDGGYPFEKYGIIKKKALAWLEKQGEQILTWSEEDEYQINTILHGLDLKRELYKKEGNQAEEERYKTQYDWLKSLKSKNHWKPTENQMSMLLAAIHDGNNANSESCHIVLQSLYNDLKTLI